jgi:hypothetical protein
MRSNQFLPFLAVAISAVLPTATATFWIFGGINPIVDERYVYQFLRLYRCLLSPLCRLDPIVNPGAVSTHVHSVRLFYYVPIPISTELQL